MIVSLHDRTYSCEALVELLSSDDSLLILGIRFRLPTLPYSTLEDRLAYGLLLQECCM